MQSCQGRDVQEMRNHSWACGLAVSDFCQEGTQQEEDRLKKYNYFFFSATPAVCRQSRATAVLMLHP